MTEERDGNGSHSHDGLTGVGRQVWGDRPGWPGCLVMVMNVP